MPDHAAGRDRALAAASLPPPAPPALGPGLRLTEAAGD